jgi:hypothetical protein
MTTLNKDEKAQIISSHLKSLAYSKYNLEIDTLQENSKSSPNADVLTSISSQSAEVDAQIAALTAELAEVEALTE